MAFEQVLRKVGVGVTPEAYYITSVDNEALAVDVVETGRRQAV